ncbi:hypothetical protein RSAG8_13836, partial [Rhizoctonia solani AG-8 WAC10335]
MHLCGQVPFFPATHLPTAVMPHGYQCTGFSGVSTRISFGNGPKRHEILCWSSMSPEPAVVYCRNLANSTPAASVSISPRISLGNGPKPRTLACFW